MLEGGFVRVPRLSDMSWVVKVHDLAICIWAMKFIFEGQTTFGIALLGWYSLVWLIRIFDIHEAVDWNLPEYWGVVLMTVFYILLIESFLVWVYWKDAVDYIVSHY